MGIEPTLAAWEAAVLPLNYTRVTRAVYAAAWSVGNAGRIKSKGSRRTLCRLAFTFCRGQKPALTVANTVAWLACFWPTVRLVPMLASKPKTLVRAPNVSVL